MILDEIGKGIGNTAMGHRQTYIGVEHRGCSMEIYGGYTGDIWMAWRHDRDLGNMRVAQAYKVRLWGYRKESWEHWKGNRGYR